jgi:hypothetical protein
MTAVGMAKITRGFVFRLLSSLCAGLLTLVAGIWLNTAPLLSRWDDITYQLENSLDLDPYPLGWPRWFFHDLSGGTDDVTALTLDVGLLAVSTVGMAALIWRYYSKLSLVRWSLSGFFVVFTLCGIVFGIYASASPSSELFTIGDLCQVVLMAGIGGAWWVASDRLKTCLNTTNDSRLSQ